MQCHGQLTSVLGQLSHVRMRTARTTTTFVTRQRGGAATRTAPPQISEGNARSHHAAHAAHTVHITAASGSLNGLGLVSDDGFSGKEQGRDGRGVLQSLSLIHI